MPTKHKRGPTSRIKEWEKSDNLIRIVGWRRQGLTVKEVAQNMGVALRTLYKWRSESVQIMHALKRGKEDANFIVENVLYKKATDGNVTAMIFWLKNNYPEKYSDSQKTKTDEELSQAQVERAKIETKIAQAKLDMISDADDAQMLAIDDLFKKIADDVGSDEDGTK